MDYFLQTTDEINLLYCIKYGLWGSKSNNLKQFSSGDRMIVYVDRAIAALFRVVSDSFYDETSVWPNELYPYRVHIELEKLIQREERYSLQNADIRQALYEYHSTSYGITVVLSKRPIHTDVVDIAMQHIEAAQAWTDFDVDAELAVLQQEQVNQQEEIAEEVVEARIVDKEVEQENVTSHTRMQYYLAKLGLALGFQVWIPTPDQNLVCDGVQLAELSEAELPQLPFSDKVVRLISYIDVIWLQNQNPAHLFEIESTTAVYSGLLRMSDFVTLIPSLNIGMFICASEKRREKVRFEVNRPTFSRMQTPLAERCRFLSFEQLDEFVSAQSSYLKFFNIGILEEISESLRKTI